MANVELSAGTWTEELEGEEGEAVRKFSSFLSEYPGGFVRFMPSGQVEIKKAGSLVRENSIHISN